MKFIGQAMWRAQFATSILDAPPKFLPLWIGNSPHPDLHLHWVKRHTPRVRVNRQSHRGQMC